MKKYIATFSLLCITLLIAACSNPAPPPAAQVEAPAEVVTEPAPTATAQTEDEEDDHDHDHADEDDHHDEESDHTHEDESDETHQDEVEEEEHDHEVAEAESDHGADGHTHVLIGSVITNPFDQFGAVSISSDDQYVYVSHPTGLPDHPMMTGITNWQQQVPIPQDYTGENSWAIPLNPVFTDNGLSTTETSFRGAIAVAVNGIPIFTAVNNRGDDALAIGELDEWGGHSGRADDYHYHIPPVHLEEIVGEDMPIAYAFDGFPIYGETDAELDEHFGIQNPDGTYQYHTVLSQSPYFIPSFRGEVNYVGDEIAPQARTFGARPATDPLRGDVQITGFESAVDNSYSLTYLLDGATYTINYSWDDSGAYTYEFISPDGSSTVENYQRR